MLDTQVIKKDFPIFEHQSDLVYLDSAATALKPRTVIDAMNEYYLEYSANVARGLYPLAERATMSLEQARERIAAFIGAGQAEAVIFTANATHAINLVALGLEEECSPEHNIVVTDLEHHSNFLPWKELARRSGAELRRTPCTSAGQVDVSALIERVDQKTLVVAFAAVSNVFGVRSDVPGLVQAIRQKNPRALILIDACQAVGHFRVNFSELDADYMVFSGHKLFGPTGIGVLAGKKPALARLSAKNVGGGSVLDACSDPSLYKELPDKLEGGTPNIAGAIGLSAALEYIDRLGQENIRAHEQALAHFTFRKLRETFGASIHILGTLESNLRAGLISFTLDGLHPHDLASILGEAGICVRAGEHCAAPLHRALRLSATTRVSFSVYNDETDIEKFLSAMKKAVQMLS